METCEEHSGLNRGRRRNSDCGGSGKRKYTKRSDYWPSKTKEEGEEVESEVESEVEPEVESEVESEAESEDSDKSKSETEQTGKRIRVGPTGQKKDLCRVGECPKYKQNGRDGMCAAHFNAANLRGIEAVLAEGIEIGAQTNVHYSARKKHGNKKKSKSGRSSSESPPKLRAKRSKQGAETSSSVKPRESSPKRKPRESSPKKKKPVETAEQPTASRSLEEELGLPKYEDTNDSNKCLVGKCSLSIQVPRQYKMCRRHYRELVADESEDNQQKYTEYALLVRPPKTPGGSSPSKSSPKKSSKAKASPRKRKMSTDGTEGIAAKTTKRHGSRKMPTVIDDRRAPDTTEEAVALVSAQVCDIWKMLPSQIDLNSPPPILEAVFFGDIAADDSTSDAKPNVDENSVLEDEASTKTEGLKPLSVESVDLDPKMNYNIIHLAVKSRLAAENYTSALSLCQKALLDWYDWAEKCARFHRDDPPKGAVDSNVSSMGAVCDSLAGLWCVYAWLLQELIALNLPRSPSNPDDIAMATETKSLPPSSAPSSPSNDSKFLPGTVIPEGLFRLSHDNVQWRDVLATLKVATHCHLAGRRAWPWLARARATVRSSEVAAGKAKVASLPPTAASDTNNLQTNASVLVLKGYGDAVAICREGIGRVSSLPSVHLAKSRKLLVPTSIQDVTLPYFGQENARTLCRETNHIFDMKRRVEKALSSQNDNAKSDAAVVLNGTSNDAKAQDTSHQLQTNNNQSASTISAFHAVEWVCNGCAEHFTDKDTLRSHKSECSKKAAKAKEGNNLEIVADEKPLVCNVSRAPVFGEAEAMDILDYLVEIFPASKDDMGRRTGGRPAKVHAEGDDESIDNDRGLLANNPIFEGQVGLRCIHCRDDDGISGVIFPPTIDDLPRAIYRMQVSHFERCKCLPNDCRARYEVMRNSVVPDGIGSKRYWNEVADGLHLQDTSKGIMWPAGNITASAAAKKAGVRFDGSV